VAQWQNKVEQGRTRIGAIAAWAAAGLLGGLIGCLAAVALTELIKLSLAAAAGLGPAALRLLPLLGVGLAVLILYGLGRGQSVQTIAPRQTLRPGITPGSLAAWYSFPHDIARADLTGDVVNASGLEERFPWNLAPLRALAILATVGLGAPMGTESPAAHIGVATGSWLGSSVPALRALARPLAIGGGAASVSALIGIPLVGSFFMAELAARRHIPLSAPRAAAMLAGGLSGWAVHSAFQLDLIRLVVPRVPPGGFLAALQATLCIGPHRRGDLLGPGLARPTADAPADRRRGAAGAGVADRGPCHPGSGFRAGGRGDRLGRNHQPRPAAPAGPGIAAGGRHHGGGAGGGLRRGVRAVSGDR
jgi:H+/Cl- antiporter ClcA